MRLNLHGAAQTVIGSVRLLEVIGSKLVLDRGLYPGRRDQSNRAIGIMDTIHSGSMR